MLGLGWGEMLVIAVVVLIVVGPKDLPVLMRNIGRMMGSVRKMSNEFRREIDKAIAADEIREAKKAISDPLKQTSADITKEFNAIRDGKVEPSGKLKPSEPGKESVADEIRAQAGMLPKPPRVETAAAAAAMQAKVTERVASRAQAIEAVAPTVAASGAAVAPVKGKVKAAKPKAASAASSKKPAARKPVTSKAAAKPAAKATGEGKAPAKSASKAAPKAESTQEAAPAPKSAKKPASTKARKAKVVAPAEEN